MLSLPGFLPRQRLRPSAWLFQKVFLSAVAKCCFRGWSGFNTWGRAGPTRMSLAHALQRPPFRNHKYFLKVRRFLLAESTGKSQMIWPSSTRCAPRPQQYALPHVAFPGLHVHHHHLRPRSRQPGYQAVSVPGRLHRGIFPPQEPLTAIAQRPRLLLQQRSANIGVTHTRGPPQPTIPNGPVTGQRRRASA